ncbi:hypothetical protein DFH29DRAFT_881328 [Suillus ampliporus]|nr:hypothetical protein DFH29DRAFT_881328 [Suillus ampliporus]
MPLSPHRAQSNNFRGRKNATPYKGSSLGTNCPQLLKRTSISPVARLTAIPPSSPISLNHKFHGFQVTTPPAKVPKVEISKKDVLCGQIIAFLKGEGQPEDTNADFKIFSDVSINDYNFIIEAIAEDDNNQFNQYKLSHSLSSNQLVATLPTPLHKNLLEPLRDTINAVLASMGIDEALGNFIIQMNTTLRGEGEGGSTEKALGTPDVLVEFHDGDGGRLQLWGTEISFSQAWDAAIAKLQRSVIFNKFMQAVTLFDVLEDHRYSSPAESSHVFQTLSETDRVVPYCKWLQKDDLPVFGPVTGFTHNWVSSLTVVVTTWVRPDDGPFDLYDQDPRYYATAQLCPDTDLVGLDNVQQLFHHTFASIRDTTISHLEDLMAEEEGSSAESNISDESGNEGKSHMAEASAIRCLLPLTPSSSFVHWKKVMIQLQTTARQTGYTRYSIWHEKLIKRKAEEAEISSRSSKRTRRSR